MPRAALRPPLARRRCVAASSSRSREPARGVPSTVPNPSEETDYLRAMPVPFAVVKTIPDEEGRTVDLVFAYVNDAAIALAGCAREVLVGSSVFDACPDVARCMLGVLDDTARTGAAQYFTCRSVSGDRYFSVRSYRPREGFCACVLQDVTEQALLDRRLREERRLLERQAMRDPLTGLYHVRQGRRLVEGALAEPRWEGACSALFMFDVDDFKKVNDEHGHHRGDDVLRGGGGRDQLVGGAGDDTYFVDTPGDRVFEGAGQGTDRVVATSTYRLAADQEVEILQLARSTGGAPLSLTGNTFGQTLLGNAGDNRLDGGCGDDRLAGGLGEDRLTGGSGADTFVFDTPSGRGNVDHVRDFVSRDDGFQLDHAVFSRLAIGVLAPEQFKQLGPAKADADDRILYRQKTGELFYDADGSGRKEAVLIAVLDNHAILDHTDFLIV